MPERSRKPRDLNAMAASIVDQATNEGPTADLDEGKPGCGRIGPSGRVEGRQGTRRKVDRRAAFRGGTECRAEAMGPELTGVETAAERDSNRIIEQQLDERGEAVEAAAGADVLTYIGPIYGYASDAIKDAVETIQPRRGKLLVVLETGGGYIDQAERIARIFRHHYRRVDFLVPAFAMSAGTVLVMSGDSILMDYASILGPIDPQVARGNDLVPALGYLVQYERLIEK